MTPSQIRSKLEQFAESGSYTVDDLARLNQSWLNIRDTTPQSYHAVIDDRIRALRTNLDLPELPSLARLIIQHDLVGEYEAIAINLDDRSQVALGYTPAYEFICDSIGLDQALSDCYNAGYPVAVGMTAENWQLWVEANGIAQQDADFVWLTVSRDGERDDCASAMCMTDFREVVVPNDELQNLLADLIGFNPSSFERGFGTVCRMSVANWDAWLEHFEVADLPEDVAAALCA